MQNLVRPVLVFSLGVMIVVPPLLVMVKSAGVSRVKSDSAETRKDVIVWAVKGWFGVPVASNEAGVFG